MSESNMQVSAGSIFICYRREDSADVTGRISDRLVDHFGPERVFMDVEAIRLGYDFRSEIDQTIKVCSIVIVVIGDEWLAEVDGKRRIDDENDRVRIEIEAALRREIPIIPVLTRGASHPTKAMLPASLEDLAYRHGTSIRHEHFRGDLDSLISQLDKLLARQASTPSAETKETTPVKSTQTTQSPPISPAASIAGRVGYDGSPGKGNLPKKRVFGLVGAIVVAVAVILALGTLSVLKRSEALKLEEQKRRQLATPQLSKSPNGQRQTTPQPIGQMWAYYGEQTRASPDWSKRYFDVQGGNKTSVPKPNDIVTAVNNVNGHGPKPVWDNETGDVKLGPHIGDIKPGDKALVLEILDLNKPTDENAYYFIHLSLLPKE
jgi:hypothetical protein